MKEKILKIIQLSKTATAKNTYLVFIGNAIAGFLGMIAMILVSRYLGPASFGAFSVAFALSTLLLKLGDLGLNFGMVREISQSRAKNEHESIIKIFLTVFWIKVLISSIIIVFGQFYLKYISINLFNSPLSFTSNQLVFGLFFLDVFYDLVRVFLEANKRFLEGVLVYIVANLIKIPLLIVCYLFLPKFKELIIIYLLAPFIASLIFYPRLKIKLKLAFYKEEFKKLLKFTSWMSISVIFSALGENLNIFMVSAKLNNYETGIYSAADKFIIPFYIFAAALGTVLIPRASEFIELAHIKKFIKKIITLQFLLLLMFIFIFPCAYLLPWLFGKDYQPSVIILQTLIIANFFRIAITPLNSVFYPLNKSVIFAIDSVIQVIFLFSLNQYFIIKYQAIGAAYSLLITNIVIFIFNFIFLYYALKKHEQETINLG